MGPLYVISVISNPVRYKSRLRLYQEFAARMEATADVVLIRVEQAFGDRPFLVTEAGNPHHVQVRAGAESEVWVKESLINLGFRHLYVCAPDWKNACWSDSDIEFLRARWANETVEALQHWKIVQPWTTAMDMGPHFAPIGQATSFCRDYFYGAAEAAKHGKHDPHCFLEHSYCGKMRDGHKTFHPGYAWAIRRETWEKIGPLIDWVPLGSADHHMAWAFVGRLDKAVHGKASAGYRRRAATFQARCEKHLRGDIGFVDGTIIHYWHGQKKNRLYVEREQTLIQVGFDPDTDVTFNHHGLLVLTDHNLKLRDAVRRYFRARLEDSTDLE